jgi:serine/threonine protein kinase/Tfp pilus assembly protein PilF
MTESAPTAETIVLTALEIELAQERAAYVRQACQGNPQLQARVDRLLRAHMQLGRYLGQSTPAPGGMAASTPSAAETPVPGGPTEIQHVEGARIGPYQVVQQIGAGGMGTVYLAVQQEPVQRLVALKLVKPELDSKQVLARFELERQALALMDHPNIARVFDAGTTDSGRPYFVMELVQGVPITRYCDECRLTLKQRLELFVPVCQAVQHAHQKGIIHRDLKPSNVLVTLYDGQAVPKVIDFGIAKATGPEQPVGALFTQVGQIVGTLEYMSPEQANLNQLDIDTRSDIYSLGVLLYELLTGTTPLSRKRLQEAALLEALRLIREEEPPRPSSRLSESKETLPSIAAQRQTEPTKLARLVRGELDWIVLKCLDKDRGRRYGTANDLAADLQRYLHQEPVLAGPPSRAYRLRKFLRRNRGPVLAAVALLVALVGGIIGTTVGMLRAERARQAEEQRAEGERLAREEVQKRLKQIEKGAAILASVFHNLDPRAEEKEGVSLRVLLGKRLGEAVQQLEGEAVGDPVVGARVQMWLGDSLRSLGYYDQAEIVLSKARRTLEASLGTDQHETLTTGSNLARLYHEQGKLPQAEALFKEVLEIYTTRRGVDSTAALTTKNNLALVYADQGKYAQAQTLLEEALEGRTTKLGANHPDTLATKNNLATLYHTRGMYEQAEKLYKEVLDQQTARLGADHPDTLTARHNLGLLYLNQGKYTQAETLAREVLEGRTAKLGADHPETLATKHNLALVYVDQGKYPQAEVLFKEVLEVCTARLGADHPHTLTTRRNLARLYSTLKKFDLSTPLFQEVLAQRKKILGASHPDTVVSLADLGINYREAGRLEDGIRCLEEALTILRNSAGQPLPQLSWIPGELGPMYYRARQFAQAERLYSELLQQARTQFGDDDLRTAAMMAQLALNLLAQKKHTQAEPVLRSCLAIRARKQPDDWTTFNVKSMLGEALLGQKKYAEAEPLLKDGYQGLKQRRDKMPPVSQFRLTETVQQLVDLYEATGNQVEAATWRQELETLKKPQ